VFRELAKVIVKAGARAAVKAGPKSRLTDGSAPCCDHGAIIISHPADHVRMWLDVAHRLVFHGPGATGWFGSGSGNWFEARVTQAQKHMLGATPIVPLEFAERALESVPSKIAPALGPLKPVHEGCYVDQLGARLEETEIQQFLSIHTALLY